MAKQTQGSEAPGRKRLTINIKQLEGKVELALENGLNPPELRPRFRLCPAKVDARRSNINRYDTFAVFPKLPPYVYQSGRSIDGNVSTTLHLKSWELGFLRPQQTPS